MTHDWCVTVATIAALPVGGALFWLWDRHLWPFIRFHVGPCVCDGTGSVTVTSTVGPPTQEPCPFCVRGRGEAAGEPPVYATREDALRDVMRSGRAAVFEADERGEYRKTWEEKP